MLLRGAAAGAALVVALAASPAAAQGLTPMKARGLTPSNAKAFYLTVLNPYSQRLRFVLDALEPRLDAPAEAVRVRPSEMWIAPGGSRRALVILKLPEGQKERSVAVCVTPQDLPGTVVPRVCSTLTGVRPGAR